MHTWKDNVNFVLVRPKEPGNIGAAARAIKNMGFRHLGLVRPPEVMTQEAEWFACHALDILHSASAYTTLPEALQGMSLVVGTTRRTGKRRGLILPVEQGVERIIDVAGTGKVAILFGSEARGLSNEDVDECGYLMTIPSSRRQPSLNLSQAVLIVAYELSKKAYRMNPETTEPPQKTPLVSYEELSTLYRRIEALLELLGYIPRGNRDLKKKIMQNLKHFIGRTGITRWEMKMLHGICTQIEERLGKP